MQELYGTPIDEITFAQVVAFCNQQRPENIRLDYKAQLSGNKRPALEIAKDVSSFANSEGGRIIFGVEEQGNSRKPKPHPVGQNLGNNARQTVINACASELWPPLIPEVSDYITDPNDHSRGFLIVQVAASVDVPHTVEGKTGIYIRADDHNVPVRATVEQVGRLIARREAASSIQRTRRTDGVSQLRCFLSKEPGNMEITLGPILADRRLFDVRELRDLASRLSVGSAYFNGETAPLDSRLDRLRAAPDCIYSAGSGAYDVGDFGYSIGRIDIYGNVFLLTCLSQQFPVDTFGMRPDEIAHMSRWKKGESSYSSIRADVLVERLITVMRAGLNVYREAGFIGGVELAVRLPGVNGYPLVQRQTRYFRVLGICELEADVEVTECLTTTELGGDFLETLDGLVRRLLWAWGCFRDDAMPRSIIDCAERLHYGECDCGCKSRPRAHIREKCLECRTKEETKTGAG